MGVANDAVNFTNSAVGSRVAFRWVILLTASLGIFLGTMFSGGMMEVARKGVFNPENFLFFEVMVIFLAVMFTDVMLLDLYNTFGLPTSTTVSLVFELLGASVAVAIIKIVSAGEPISQLAAYINSDKALAMIGGILVSVILAFLFGMVIQFISRIIFTFDYMHNLKRYGSFWCAIVITLIVYYIMIKGAPGSVLVSLEMRDWISQHSGMVVIINFAFWLVIFQIVLWFTRINILKLIVLLGTFALALSFAANDLVNFIGVPMAGLASYQLARNSGDPFSMTMEGLHQPVIINILILLIASMVMVLSLWISKKARGVTQTEVDLARQEKGAERFESSLIARIIVDISLALFESIQKIIPNSVRQWIAGRLDIRMYKSVNHATGKVPSFDLIRASVNLMVASSLISFGTSLKLPLSTTYVTFMVAMGTSLADKAWGIESAASRLTGVLTVIGGWFFTAFSAFIVAAFLAFIIYFGKFIAIFLLIILSIFFVYKTHAFHRMRQKV